MIERPSARLILLDPQDRLFLFKVHDPAVFDPAYPFHDPFWVMIGGMVDAGEDFAEAAVREADEETKLPVIDTPRWVWTRERRMSWRGRDVLHKERFFLAHTDRTEADTVGPRREGTALDARPPLVDRRRDRGIVGAFRADRSRRPAEDVAARRAAEGADNAWLAFLAPLLRLPPLLVLPGQ